MTGLKEFCRAIYKARREAGMSLREAARKIEISVSRLCDLEGRRAAPSLEVCERIARAYTIDPGYVLSLLPKKPRKAPRKREMPTKWKWAVKEFGRLVRKWRAEMPPDLVAVELGVDPSYLRAIERGTLGIPSPALCRRFARMFGKKPRRLLLLKMLEGACEEVREEVAGLLGIGGDHESA